MNGPSVSTQARDAAIAWMVRLQSGQSSPQDEAAWLQWRQASDEHEHAWQRVSSLLPQQRAATVLLSNPDARSALERAGPVPGSRRRFLQYCFVAGALGAASWQASQTPTVRAALATYRTGTGERRKWQLADGTTLWLNTRSAVDVNFTASERGLQLIEGEITLNVPNEARALHLRTPHAWVRSQGAELCVRCDDSGTRVALLRGEGTVGALEGGTMQTLKVGEQLRVQAGRLLPSAAIAPTAAKAWVSGFFPAERIRLDELLAELGRYRPGFLRCAPEVAGLRLTGNFPVGDTDAALVIVEASLPVRTQRLTRFWVTVTAA